MVESALVALVKDGTYDEIGQKYPDIYDFLSLSADSVEDVEVPEGAADEYGAGFVFKHGFDLDYPPYSYLQDDGTVGGFDVELCQAVCEYLGWEYEAVPFNWDAKDAELNSGSCDCIWSGFTLEGREDDYCWSMPYSNNTQVILVAGDSDISSLADLAGKTVGVQTATSAYDLLQEDQAELAGTFGELLVYETYTIAFNDLEAGAVDAIAIDKPVALYLISGAD
ncbi:MAG: transporter substrate-binding domain-containing protein [Clostridia bacterium]|nr:transporter substrate-binding domain-containing protein [Clostridia bacterium]